MERLLATAFALLLGATALMAGITSIRTARKVRSWPTVPGRIVARDVVPSEAGNVSTPGRRYRAVVRYAYEVAGKAYEGERIVAFGTITGPEEAMRREVAAFGDVVEVRYDPANPAEACLRPQPAGWAPGFLAAAALCFLVALVTAVTT